LNRKRLPEQRGTTRIKDRKNCGWGEQESDERAEREGVTEKLFVGTRGDGIWKHTLKDQKGDLERPGAQGKEKIPKKGWTN